MSPFLYFSSARTVLGELKAVNKEITVIKLVPPHFSGARVKSESNTSCVFALLSLVIGGTGTTATAAITIHSLWWIGPGTHVNLMNLVAYQVVIALLTAFWGSIMGVLALLSGFGRWKPVGLSALAIFCSYIPMFAANWITTWIINNHHLILIG